MKLRQIFESHHKATAAFCFGRFNPAHQGHARVWEAVAHAGQHWYIGTNPSTIGPNDPLPFAVKSAWMAAIDPHVKGHIVGEQSVVTLAAKIFQQVGEGATVAYITDHTDWAWSGKLLNDYNGKEGNHGYYNFAKIIHVESPRVTSATDLRNAARAGDEQTFYHLAGVDPELRVAGKTYFETVAEALGHHPEKVKRAKKEKAVAADESMIDDSDSDTRFDPHPHHRQWFPIDDQWPEVVGVDGKLLDPSKKEDVNLIKYANKTLREMRAQDFVSEGHPNAGTGHTTELNPHHDNVMKGVSRSRDVGGYDRVYHMNRMMMAMAMHDGKGPHPVDSAEETWFEKYNTMHPMTQEEDNMIRGAMKTVPTDGQHISKFSKSKEADGGNKVSTVAQRKKNKYGI